MDSLTVQDIMTPSPFSLFEDDDLSLVGEFIKWKAIRHIPIVGQKNQLVGLLTHKDLLKLTIGLIHNGQEGKKFTVGQVMKRNVWAIDPNTSLAEAAKLMRLKNLGCLPVIHLDDRTLVGIVTEADFVRFFVDKEILIPSSKELKKIQKVENLGADLSN